MTEHTLPIGTPPVTEAEVDNIMQRLEEQRAAQAAEWERKQRKDREDRKRALLDGRVPWPCGPCRSCVRQILNLVEVDRTLCERP
jgi:hypothetical protein